jgi:hypothetical protein
MTRKRVFGWTRWQPQATASADLRIPSTVPTGQGRADHPAPLSLGIHRQGAEIFARSKAHVQAVLRDTLGTIMRCIARSPRCTWAFTICGGASRSGERRELDAWLQDDSARSDAHAGAVVRQAILGLRSPDISPDMASERSELVEG